MGHPEPAEDDSEKECCSGAGTAQRQWAWKRARAKGSAARKRMSEEGTSVCPSAIQGGTLAEQQLEAVFLIEAEDASPASTMERGPEPGGQKDAAAQSGQGACTHPPALGRARGRQRKG